MGEAQSQPFQLSFNPALRVEFQGSRVTSDGGLILVRELDERLGFSDLIAQHVTDPRWNPSIQGVQVHAEDDSRSQNANSGKELTQKEIDTGRAMVEADLRAYRR